MTAHKPAYGVTLRINRNKGIHWCDEHRQAEYDETAKPDAFSLIGLALEQISAHDLLNDLRHAADGARTRLLDSGA